MFAVSDELLTRTDIMPFFRPAGATNRIALDWKVKLGMKKSFEELDVMDYMNSDGSNVPQLKYINKSIRPDEDTLGKNAKSPGVLFNVGKIWTGLYGWSDADNLHFLITGIHLDSNETWTWFPSDWSRSGARVLRCRWSAIENRARFSWDYCQSRCPLIGARSEEAIPLRSQS
jgi:hypothetical protein